MATRGRGRSRRREGNHLPDGRYSSNGCSMRLLREIENLGFEVTGIQEKQAA
jgi:hypothetical protein